MPSTHTQMTSSPHSVNTIQLFNNSMLLFDEAFGEKICRCFWMTLRNPVSNRTYSEEIHLICFAVENMTDITYLSFSLSSSFIIFYFAYMRLTSLIPSKNIWREQMLFSSSIRIINLLHFFLYLFIYFFSSKREERVRFRLKELLLGKFSKFEEKFLDKLFYSLFKWPRKAVQIYKQFFFPVIYYLSVFNEIWNKGISGLLENYE